MLSYILSIFLLVLSLNTFASDIFPGTNMNTGNPFEIDSLAGQKKIVINKIILIGNKTTKPQIIFRELLFHEKDTVQADQLSSMMEQSRKNLLNTTLFNFVTIDSVAVAPGIINISIDVIERWYVWPVPFFQLTDRNFNVWWKTRNLSKADYGINYTWNNFRGRMESIVFTLKSGYDQTFGLTYKIPYVNKRKTLGIIVNGGFSGNHEVPYITEDNEQLFYKDEERHILKNISSNFSITYRKNIFNSHVFQLSYDDYRFADTLIDLDSLFSSQSHLQYFTFYYMFKSDHRDIKAYPLTGYYFDLEATKHGFGILKQENINMAFLHSSVRKFWQLHNRWYLAAGINAKISTNAFQPYFLERGLGYGSDFVRSYEDYVVDGQDFILLKSNLKFELIPTKIKEFNFIPSKKFSKLYYSLYLNLLADAGYVHDRQVKGINNLSDSPLFGTGIGLDFVTYYDKVYRLEYSVNKEGVGGIFIHFVAPI